MLNFTLDVALDITLDFTLHILFDFTLGIALGVAFDITFDIVLDFTFDIALDIRLGIALNITLGISVDSQNALCKASHSLRITCDMSAMSMLESGEQRYLKAINIKNTSSLKSRLTL